MISLSLSLNPSLVSEGPFSIQTSNAGIKKLLESQARQIVPMLPDGNCLFRSVAHQLVGDWSTTPSYSCFRCSTWTGTKGVFTPGRGNWNSFISGLQRMCKVGCWETHFELRAMTSMLQVPIYVLTDSLVPGECRWTRFCFWRWHCTSERWKLYSILDSRSPSGWSAATVDRNMPLQRVTLRQHRV